MPSLAPARKYGKCLSLGVKAGIEYRVNILFSIAGAISPVVIQTALWLVLYAGDPGAIMFGFTFPQMVAYTVIAQLVTRIVRTGFEYDVNYDIKSGGLDRYLVKPIGYFGFRIFSFLGDKLVQGAAIGALLAVSVVVMSTALGFATTAASVLLFVLALFLALAMNFLLFWCVSLSGFWLTEIGFLFEAVRIVIVAASGGILPLAVFGPDAERALKLMPFRFTIQFPTEVLSGRVPPSEMLPSFALCALWLIALAALGRVVWGRGIRRFAAVGS
ncbi:MAG TPA: ABC-2 family transporter protein [Treponemataceae bacterium]|nr:ABC-2 family transporter protein [Treponemataceae bacterium]